MSTWASEGSSVGRVNLFDLQNFVNNLRVISMKRKGARRNPRVHSVRLQEHASLVCRILDSVTVNSYWERHFFLCSFKSIFQFGTELHLINACRSRPQAERVRRPSQTFSMACFCCVFFFALSSEFVLEM